MKKILPVVLAAVLLAGCGATNGLTSARTATGTASALSKAGAEKGVRGMFRHFFAMADADKSGWLSVEEMPAPVGSVEPGQAVDPMPFKKAMFEKLDVNKNGRVTFSEFASKENVTNVTTQFRREVGRLFANMDANGDRMLVAEEMADGPVALESADRNKNGKVTLSELEDAMANVLGNGGGFGPAPAPQPPAPPAEDPNTPPAPPAEEPANPPAPPAEEPSTFR